MERDKGGGRGERVTDGERREQRSVDLRGNTMGSRTNGMEEEVEHEGCMNKERLGDSLFKGHVFFREPCAERDMDSVPSSLLSFIPLHHSLPVATSPFLYSQCSSFYSDLILFHPCLLSLSLSLTVCLFFTLPPAISYYMSLHISPSASKSCLSGRPRGHMPLEVE